MKVKINPKTNTISESIHTSKNDLTEMLKTTSQNIKKSIHIEKEDNYIKTFNKSISKTLMRNRKYYQD